jgi:hypothetical protein
MPYKDKAKNDACKRAYEDVHREEINKKRRKRYATIPEVQKQKKQYQTERYAALEKRREQVRASDLKTRFGITIEEYEARRESQRLSGNLCGLCKQPLDNVDSTPNLDHDHETLQLREFLHRACNMALGLLKDDPKICRMAAEYLERHGKRHGNGHFNTQ